MIDTDCTTCGGLGTLGCDPETCERIYCDACVYGVEMHLEHMKDAMKKAGEWMKDENWRDWPEVVVMAVREHLRKLILEHDALVAQLDTLKQDETNRPIVHLFEDL